VTANSSPRSMPAASLHELAVPVFGPDRVRIAERLDHAIEIGVALADDADAAGEGGPGKAGVLITGSVITAGDARVLLLEPGSAGRPGPSGGRGGDDDEAGGSG
jgi:dihydrofolate synthase/folylpolyglutamate synthase